MQDFPYAGLGGGLISIVVSPTGLGDIVVAKHFFTRAEIDITEYDWW
jgi:hypothetical protein